ncbi:GlmU family protein [Flavimarina sp. Hel_I_48]|uniref:GlmU family protein n=1 Tax=Flavimarina sp. Hel_I_48 TaxID=1392488 RepID=UPI0004DF503F|nr:GlmU family protein [Flavimarina sp. Hel_I_48]
MNYILFDGKARKQLLPFTFTRPVADLRIGILTIREKWEKHLSAPTSSLTEKYLSEKFQLKETNDNVLINASFLPTEELVTSVKELKTREALAYADEIVAYRSEKAENQANFDAFNVKNCPEEAIFKINHTWDLFSLNGRAIEEDFKLLTHGRTSQPIPDGVHCINKENIFLEEGAVVTFASLNASGGPIYLAKNSEVMEGCLIRGPFSLGEQAAVKMGAKIYGPTTVGPFSKVGGEINNSILMGYSNKGHDGFLGNSVLGEWCNMGADTNTSNLKNNYAEIRLWDYEKEGFEKTGLQFCGLMMGDHSKCGINTMFNTGTVVGVAANIYGGDFPRNFIPSYSWGGSAGMTTYRMDKAFETIKIVMQRRHIDFDDREQRILQHIFEESAQYRGKE